MNQVVINDFCKIDIKKGSVVTIGKFDGVHKGHQKLIKYTVNMAKKYNLLSVVMMIRKKNVSIYNMEIG
ncbi:adenylyltransferase/cytidyltransferase family protein, partial [uncultured Brachyspira sp.]|uniref:adenylyltransferase/cytidyltransferase family protein n=1 Tax=uncultured Brachyspira sp. TaxID=221953 RepID=UPI00321FA1A7